MPAPADRIDRQIESMEKRVAFLSQERRENTPKRMREAEERFKEREQLRRKIGVLQIIREVADNRPVSPFENALLTGTVLTYFDYSYRRKVKEQTPLPFTLRDEPLYKHLARCGIEDDASFRHAVALYEELVLNTGNTADPLQLQIRKLTNKARMRQGGDIQFSPDPLIGAMLECADLEAGQRVLEPSAGIGSIADAVHAAGCTVDCIERDPDFTELLEKKGHTVISQNFFEHEPNPIYHAVLMNPPFSDQCRHIQYAYDFVMPGGVLVAVCAPSVRDNSMNPYRSFREWLEDLPHEMLSMDARFEMTGVRVLLLCIWRE